MKASIIRTAVLAISVLALSGCANTQTAPTASAPAAVERRLLSVDSPLGEIFDTPAALAVLQRNVPEMAGDPATKKSIRLYSLRIISGKLPSLTPQKMADLDTELRQFAAPLPDMNGPAGDPPFRATQLVLTDMPKVSAPVALFNGKDFAGWDVFLGPAERAGGTYPAIGQAVGLNTDARKPVSLQFRREVRFIRVPSQAVVQVSADNRYVLFVNGRRIDSGPARGDLAHWRYRTIDLAPFLRSGRNVIAAQVWNDGAAAAMPQISAKSGFFLTAPAASFGKLIDTGPTWRVRIDTSRSVTPGALQLAGAVGPGKYYAAAPPEVHNAAARLNDWMAATSVAPDWFDSVYAVLPGKTAPWMLAEDRLPSMRYEQRPGGKLVRAEGLGPSRFPAAPITIPANTGATLLVDAGAVQAAYPTLTVSGGRGVEITLTYSEALYGTDKNYLPDRAQVTGGQALGLTDTFRPDGTSNSVFQPFWWRSWRFVELRVKTGGEPLRLEKFTRYATGYPLQTRARFVSSDPELNRIWQIGWDTVQLDAHETFMDTAYWEQLQYIGDTRIEALTTYLVSGDNRLGVQAIEAFDDSKVNGLPQSRWPSRERQSIPPFALLWIGMLHDFWLYQPDTAPLRRSLAGMRSVLEWYRGHLGTDGLVNTTPGWEFIDWRPTLSNAPWARERPKTDRCIITLLYIGALRQAADLEGSVSEAAVAQADLAAAERLAQVVNARCWSAERGLYADNPDKVAFSQHANALAVLYDVAPKSAQVGILDRITVRGGGIAAPEGITGTTYYFAYYLVRALDHGWSAHPTADLLRIVAGIQPTSPGFATVRIAPHLGTLKTLDAALAHPSGMIETRYRQADGKLFASIRLPRQLAGEFVWRGRHIKLQGGQNTLSLDSVRMPSSMPATRSEQ
jgi:alpha-L-rhamnosidase